MEANKRKMAYVKVSYDSGSDGDIESEEDDHIMAIAKSPVKKFTLQVAKSPTKRKLAKGTVKGGKVRKAADKRDACGSESDSESNSKDSEDNDEDDEDNDDDEEDNNDEGNTEGAGGGWADAMASILRKEAPEGGSAVLAKSQDYAKAKEEEKKEFVEKFKERQSKKKWENMAKAIPKVTDREYERTLQRISTKGVVQLFNAVRKQQKTREEKMKEVGGSQRKRAKVEASLTKGAFLDLLKGTPAPSKPYLDSRMDKTKKTPSDQPSWGVLRDDFMLGAGMKDWDKDEGSGSSEGDSGNSEDADSGLSSDSD